MLNGNVIRALVHDLLVSGDYTMQGLAYYTDQPEEVIYDIAAGINQNPTIAVSAKIIELHALARKEVYSDLMNQLSR